MSHVATIAVEIKDLDSLKRACTTLGLELKLGQKTYKWYGRSVGDGSVPKGFTKEDLGKCDHAIHVTGNDSAYEIGVVPRRDGGLGFTLLWDTWSGGFGLVEKVGGRAEKLKQQYAVEVAAKAAKKAGFRVVGRTVKKDGSIQLITQR